jgi:hypothetical protein
MWSLSLVYSWLLSLAIILRRSEKGLMDLLPAQGMGPFMLWSLGRGSLYNGWVSGMIFLTRDHSFQTKTFIRITWRTCWKKKILGLYFQKFWITSSGVNFRNFHFPTSLSVTRGRWFMDYILTNIHQK